MKTTQNQIERIIRIATCKVKSGQFNVNVNTCGGNSYNWSKYSDMAERAVVNTNAMIDGSFVLELLENNGIRQAISEVITQMIYASPDMANFNHEGYSVEVSVK